MPIAETHNGLVGLKSLLPPVRSAETYTGSLAHHYEANLGGARDALGVDAEWRGTVGHGPGP